MAIVILVQGCQEPDDLSLPPDQFGVLPKQLPENLGNLEKLVSGDKAMYEPVTNYASDSRIGKASRAIGLLDIRYEHANGTCSASLVAPDKLLTNWHCIPGDGDDGKAVKAYFVPDYLSEQNTSSLTWFEVNPVALETGDSKTDFSILKVQGDPGNSYGIIRLARQKLAENAPLMIIHHPLGGSKKVTRFDCRRAASTDSARFLHSCDTQPGSSGSPVLSDDDLALVALHYAGHPDKATKLNFAIPMEALVDRSPILKSLLGTTPSAPPAAAQPKVAVITAPDVPQPGAGEPPVEPPYVNSLDIIFVVNTKNQYKDQMMKWGKAAEQLFRELSIRYMMAFIAATSDEYAGRTLSFRLGPTTDDSIPQDRSVYRSKVLEQNGWDPASKMAEALVNKFKYIRFGSDGQLGGRSGFYSLLVALRDPALRAAEFEALSMLIKGSALLIVFINPQDDICSETSRQKYDCENVSVDEVLNSIRRHTSLSDGRQVPYAVAAIVNKTAGNIGSGYIELVQRAEKFGAGVYDIKGNASESMKTLGHAVTKILKQNAILPQ